MLIDLDKQFGGNPQVLKEKIESRKQANIEVLTRWDQLRQLIKSVGWDFLIGEIDKEFESHNSIYNANKDELDYKRGYCTGLKFPAQLIKSYQRRAVEAQKYLDSIAKKEKE